MDELSETVSLSESEMLPVELPEPEMIASGVVKSTLGKGGASVVYKIWNPQLEVFRAVKLWRLVQTEKSLSRFEQEIKITAKLKHPNIVEIYSAGKWNGLPYMETELITGHDLKTLINLRGAFPEIVVSAIALCICRSLIYAHNHLYNLSGATYRGVVHCDIKPANIMISDSGVVKLMDFGIALPSNNTNHSEGSSVIGSLQYMAPEQLESKTVDPRSDLYSLGVLLYELYSGQKAFPADTREKLIQKRKADDFVPLDCLDVNISQKARSLVEKLMQKDPEKRFQSAFELMEELQKVYWKSTDLQPHKIISGFLEGGKMELKKERDLKKLLIPVLSGVCILFIAVFLITGISKSDRSSKAKDVKSVPVSSKIDSRQNINQVDRSKQPEETIKSRAVSSSGTVPVKTTPQKPKPQIKKEVSKVQKREPAPAVESIVKEKAEEKAAVTPELILDKISILIKEGEISSAEGMVHENSLNDGEYHLLHAEILFKKDQLKAAMAEAEKALRVPSGRLSSTELRNRFLYLKACILASEYDRFPQEQSGQAAMEAWYEVKYAYRSNVSHPYYVKADREIRRISSSIQ